LEQGDPLQNWDLIGAGRSFVLDGARRRLDVALKAKIPPRALRDKATVADLAQRCEPHPNQISRRLREEPVV
jgi:hypothetical protein